MWQLRWNINVSPSKFVFIYLYLNIKNKSRIFFLRQFEMFKLFQFSFNSCDEINMDTNF